MPLYAFYPFGNDDRAPAWVVGEFPHDAAALVHAHTVLAAHPTAARVTVVEGDRHVAHLSAPPRTRTSASDEAVRRSHQLIEEARDLLDRTRPPAEWFP
jgi:hypothetical protein